MPASLKKPPTPTNLILGFLGSGKTTTILHLLEQKPAGEIWAVLVNEFGQIGIDGAIYASRNAVVRELPGGCLCCTLGPPFQVTVNRMLAEIKPNRLIIEPTGLGHPKKILDQLTQGFFQQTLDVRACICLVDPNKLKDPRYTGNTNFQDQIALADVLVANKMDLADRDALSLFHQWVQHSDPPKSASLQTSLGRLSADWLDLPRQASRSARFPNAHDPAVLLLDNNLNSNKWGQPDDPMQAAQDYLSSGKVFPTDSCFDYRRLSDVLACADLARAKALVATDQGWFVFNASDGLLDSVQVPPGQDSRIEIVTRHEPSATFWSEIDRCLL